MITESQERERMPSDTLYVRLSPALQERLAQFLTTHPEYPTQAAAGAALVRLGLEYPALQQRLAEEMAASEQLRQERMRVQDFMQYVNKLVNQTLEQHRVNASEVPISTFTMIADQVRLAAALVGHLKPGDDVGI